MGFEQTSEVGNKHMTPQSSFFMLISYVQPVLKCRHTIRFRENSARRVGSALFAFRQNPAGCPNERRRGHAERAIRTVGRAFAYGSQTRHLGLRPTPTAGITSRWQNKTNSERQRPSETQGKALALAISLGGVLLAPALARASTWEIDPAHTANSISAWPHHGQHREGPVRKKVKGALQLERQGCPASVGRGH